MNLGPQYEFSWSSQGAPGHAITTRTGPLYRMAFCSCGWQGQVARAGNALARTSQLRALIRRHLAPSPKPQ